MVIKLEGKIVLQNFFLESLQHELITSKLGPLWICHPRCCPSALKEHCRFKMTLNVEVTARKLHFLVKTI